MEKEKPRLRKHGICADKHWREVMSLAERYGFIMQACGGVATLATHNAQLKELGEIKYLQIQRMNGHCPKENGYEGCLDEFGHLTECGSCCLAEKGGKYVDFQKREERTPRDGEVPL